MIACDRIKALFSDYLDNILPLTQKQEVETHLAGCSGCRQTLEQVRFLSARMQNIPPVSASDGFDQALRQRIISGQSSSANSSTVRNLGYGFSGVAAFAALTFMVMTIINSPATNTPAAGTQPNVPTKNEIRVNRADAKPTLASETTENDSLKNRPTHLDQKIQLVDQEKK